MKKSYTLIVKGLVSGIKTYKNREKIINMALYEEIRDGLLSGIEAYENGIELKTTVVSNDEPEESKPETVMASTK